jgi:predicted ribosome quality control (RQC) complex YloA/Tae2 family protein
VQDENGLHQLLLDNTMKSGAFGQIQKIYSSIFYLNIILRLSGKTHYLFINRGLQNEPLAYSAINKLDAKFRIVDPLLEYLRKKLLNKSIYLVHINKDLPVLTLGLSNKKNYVSFYWNKKGLNFIYLTIRDDQYDIETSWKENITINAAKVNDDNIVVKILEDHFLNYFKNKEHISNYSLSLEVSNSSHIVEEIYLNKKILKLKNKKINKINKIIKNIEKDLSKLQTHEDLFDICQKQEIKFEEDVFIHKGFKIKFKDEDNEHKKRNKIYQKIKGLKKGENIQISRLENFKKKLKELKDDQENKNFNIKQLTDYRKFIIYPFLFLDNNKKNELNSNQEELKIKNITGSNVDKFSYNGVKIIFGKNVLGNQEILKNLSNKSDLWFHLENETSAHLIAKVGNISDLDLALLDLIGSILKNNLEIDGERINLMYCNVKDLKKLKGAKATVTGKKMKYISVKYQENWRHNLLQLTK